METAELGPFVLEVRDGRASLLSTHCGQCAACRAADPFACSAPGPADHVLEADAHDRSAATLLAAAGVLDAVVSSGIPLAAVQVRSRDTALAADVRSVVRSVVTDVDDGRFTHEEWVALGRAGRADVVVDLDGDLAGAAKAVRRGGAVSALGRPVTAPTPTVVAQKELSVVRPRDIAGSWRLLAARGPSHPTHQAAGRAPAASLEEA
jgi:hypothetical protein